MNLRRRFPGYQLSDQALAEVDRIQVLWRYCRKRFADNGPWLFGRFTIADAMYAPVVMRFRQHFSQLERRCRSVLRYRKP